jgi:XTP/dITP diphosphohydrolase
VLTGADGPAGPAIPAGSGEPAGSAIPAGSGEPAGSRERGTAGELILLVTSPRVAPGLLTLSAWDTLRGAARVLCGSADHPQLPALADAGITVGILAVPASGGPVPAVPPSGGPVPAVSDPAGPVPAVSDPAVSRSASASAGLARAEPGPVSAARPEGHLARLLAAAAAQANGPVVWLAGGPVRPALGTGPADGTGALLSALRELGPPAPAVTVLVGAADLPGARLLDLVATMAILRAECPWDAKQTHESLAPHLLEEPYEALEALESGDHRALREELGDVLLQVLFHAQVASERDDGTGYTVDDIADGIVAKLVRRHPHVFADVAVSGADEVTQNWDAIKKAERAEKAVPGDAAASAVDGVPFGQPALALAAQLQRRAARAAIPPELPHAGPDGGDPGAELGDRLFGLVAAARAEGLDPEAELRAAARRYTERVRAWERAQTGGR